MSALSRVRGRSLEVHHATYKPSQRAKISFAALMNHHSQDTDIGCPMEMCSQVATNKAGASSDQDFHF
jgi:hypothetical protein